MLLNQNRSITSAREKNGRGFFEASALSAQLPVSYWILLLILQHGLLGLSNHEILSQRKTLTDGYESDEMAHLGPIEMLLRQSGESCTPLCTPYIFFHFPATPGVRATIGKDPCQFFRGFTFNMCSHSGYHGMMIVLSIRTLLLHWSISTSSADVISV